MFDKLEKVKQRYNEIAELLSKPEAMSDQKEYIKLSKEYASLTEIIQAYDEYEKTKHEHESSKKLLFETNDAEIRDLFIRLNTNNIALNDQELRNSKFKGRFKQCAERLAPLQYQMFPMQQYLRSLHRHSSDYPAFHLPQRKCLHEIQVPPATF